MALSLGETAPDFSLPATDGQTCTYNDVTGEKVTVVLFWCNHCPYVQGSERRVINMQFATKQQGVNFVAINANRADAYAEDDFPHMVQRSKDKSYNFPYLHDETQDVARAYGAQRTPEAFLFDAAKRLRYHGRIDDNPQDEAGVKSHDLQRAIDAVLVGQEPDPGETGPIGCTIKWK